MHSVHITHSPTQLKLLALPRAVYIYTVDYAVLQAAQAIKTITVTWLTLLYYAVSI